MDGADLLEVVQKFGTPLYLYSEKSIQKSYTSFQKGIGSRRGLVCFSVKSNSNINILRLIAGLGGGFDIVSGGELYRTSFTGVDSSKIVFSGVGKSEREIVEALDAQILLFIVE
ncbi:MAG: diaminopimelate decarboxylase, partial [Spirochaetia bacterium]|nr:diaminopimelate decarboxylase [Spirochaetia bacterium]